MVRELRVSDRRIASDRGPLTGTRLHDPDREAVYRLHGAILVGGKDKGDPMKYIVAALLLFAGYQAYAFVRDVSSHERFEANRCRRDGDETANCLRIFSESRELNRPRVAR